MDRIVVGLTDSHAARQASRWAYQLATHEHARLIDGELGGTQQGLQVSGEVLCGNAGDILVAKSFDADLLVLGKPHSKLGRFSGSTTKTCLRGAGCPVVIIPDMPASQAADAHAAEL